MDLRTDLWSSADMWKMQANISSYRNIVTWTSRNGTRTFLCDLHIAHLENIIRYIRRTGCFKETLPVLTAELAYRKDVLFNLEFTGAIELKII